MKGHSETVAKLIELGSNLIISHPWEEYHLNLRIEESVLLICKNLIIAKKYSKVVAMISNISKQASGYIKDNDRCWSLIEKVVKNIPDDEHMKIIIESANNIDNTTRKVRLLNFLPKQRKDDSNG